MIGLQYQEDLKRPEAQREFVLCELEAGSVALVLTSPYMVNLAIQHGHRGPVMMDATHGMVMYGYKLVTLLVVNDQRKGEPIGWAIIEHETTAVYVKVIGLLKERFERHARLTTPGFCWLPSCWLVDDSDAEIGGIRCVFCPPSYYCVSLPTTHETVGLKSWPCKALLFGSTYKQCKFCSSWAMTADCLISQ